MNDTQNEGKGGAGQEKKKTGSREQERLGGMLTFFVWHGHDETVCTRID